MTKYILTIFLVFSYKASSAETRDVLLESFYKEMTEKGAVVLKARILYLNSCEGYTFYKEKETALSEGKSDASKTYASNCLRDKKEYVRLNKEWRSVAKAKIRGMYEQSFWKTIEEKVKKANAETI